MNTGGPAFPSTHHNGWGEPEKGMTLRDYFAAKAMQGIVSREVSHMDRVEKYAEGAYAMADAMLEAREL